MKKVLIPLRTYSALNQRVHWSIRARRARKEREAAYLMTPKAKPPCIVTLTRVAPRPLDDDNLRGALKGIRDGVADRLGVDDADPGVQWLYGQEKGEYGVVVEVVPDRRLARELKRQRGKG